MSIDVLYLPYTYKNKQWFNMNLILFLVKHFPPLPLSPVWVVLEGGGGGVIAKDLSFNWVKAALSGPIWPGLTGLCTLWTVWSFSRVGMSSFP